MSNITKVVFAGCRTVNAGFLYRYDYGQLMEIVGIPDLPTNFEVHFSNNPKGQSTTQIGTDGIVSIPDMYLATGLPVYAWIFLHTGTDDGETVYEIIIQVKNRAEITDEQPTPQEQSVITETIAALNVGVARAEAAAEEIENMEVEAETLQPGSSAYADWSDGTLTLGIPRGDKGEKGDPGEISFYICQTGEYDPDTGVPTIEGESGVIYLTPKPLGQSRTGTATVGTATVSNDDTVSNTYYEFIWDGDKFEKIGDTAIDLSGYLKVSDIATDAAVEDMLDDIGL